MSKKPRYVDCGTLKRSRLTGLTETKFSSAFTEKRNIITDSNSAKKNLLKQKRDRLPLLPSFNVPSLAPDKQLRCLCGDLVNGDDID